MDALHTYLSDFKAKLPTIIEHYKAECTSKIQELDDVTDYEIPEHPLVESHPLVKIKPELYDEKVLKNPASRLDIKELDDSKQGILPEVRKSILELNTYKNNSIPTFTFTLQNVLQHQEYVIYVSIFARNTSRHMNSEYGNGYDVVALDVVTIVYITNYGRILKLIEYMSYSSIGYADNWRPSYSRTNPEYEIIGKHLRSYNYGREKGSYSSRFERTLNTNSKPLTEVTLAPLQYKMPKLFFEVLEAYRLESTEFMQKCCEAYHQLRSLAKVNLAESKKLDEVKTNTEFQVLKTSLEQHLVRFFLVLNWQFVDHAISK